MQRLKKFIFVLLAGILITLPQHGCALKINRAPTHVAVDCRSCHAPGGVPGVMDFSAIYAALSLHHPAGIKYPAGSNAKPGFNSPDRHSNDVAFFDRNGNGQPDSDEIQLFGGSGLATVECASCHREHGNAAAPANAVSSPYLRIDNVGSALCTTCHSY